MKTAVANKKRAYFWDKSYTHEQLMKESRWLLLFITVVHVAMAIFLFLSAGGKAQAVYNAIGAGITGCLYLAGALIPSFWLRVACLSLWVVDLVYTSVTLPTPRPASILFIVIGIVFIYKLLKYRGVHSVPASEPREHSKSRD
jgi:hypothetical protein